MSSQASSSASVAPSSLKASSDPSAPAKEEAITFTAHSRSVHLYRPIDDSKASSSLSSSPLLSPLSTSGPAPAAVVIMGWMDAPLRIVSKYAAPYAKLFPRATIIVKLSSGTSFVAKKEARDVPLLKVIEILEEVNEKKSSDSGMILHSFSDGGAHNLSQLLPLCTDRKVPTARAIIFDCSPGRSTPYSSSTAFTIPLARRPLLRAAVRSILYLYFSILFFVKRITGRQTWSQTLRAKLNDPSQWKAVYNQKAVKNAQFPPRLYLYSRADALINWQAVESHAQEAASMQALSGPITAAEVKSNQVTKKGGPVTAWRRWEDANHCDIGRKDFPGYWTAVRSYLEGVL